MVTTSKGSEYTLSRIADPTGTVVVCTRNRVDVLAQCLASVALQQVARERFEVVVVDNGSTDPTPAWLDRPP